jgi:hypothetical protein
MSNNSKLMSVKINGIEVATLLTHVKVDRDTNESLYFGGLYFGGLWVSDSPEFGSMVQVQAWAVGQLSVTFTEL